MTYYIHDIYTHTRQKVKTQIPFVNLITSKVKNDKIIK